MKQNRTITLIATLLMTLAVGSACISKGTENMGNDRELLVQKTSQPSQLLKRYAYTTSYNKVTRLPNWVAWYLTKDHTYGQYKRKGLRFEEDNDVPTPRATYLDYMQSGYSRGHMCPSGDNRWSEQAQKESFLYTNCCPQNYDLNAGAWNDLEIKCREWAKAYGKIYIVCGPVFYGDKHRTIGKNRVTVPEAFYKVILCLNGTPKGIGFIYDNKDNATAEPLSIDSVERITGIDFFPALPDDIERQVEAKADIRDWK